MYQGETLSTTENTNATTGATIVLIHGLWMTPLSWEHWSARFTAKGHRVLAPGWPGVDVNIDQLRRDPSSIAGLNVRDIVDNYERIIRGLDSPPVIMGHSFGGGFVQLLLDRGLGSAGVAIDAAALRGVRDLPFSTLRSGWPMLRNPFMRHRAIGLTPKQFHYAFCNTLTEEDSRKYMTATTSQVREASCSRARSAT
jgi:pimeloyl-ACP methyl ester carboxylesterase